MSTYNHTDISHGAAANADTINTPLGTIDAAIGDLTGLPTTPKTSLAGSLGTTALGTTALTFSGAIAEHSTKIAVSVDTDGTLKAGAVDVAAVLAADVVETAKIKNLNVTFAKLATGAAAENATLIIWTESEAYEITGVTYDSDGVPLTATVKWPDASAGTFTVTTKNTTWLAIDAYTIIHAASGKNVTQAAVTRDANGQVTVKPALMVA